MGKRALESLFLNSPSLLYLVQSLWELCLFQLSHPNIDLTTFQKGTSSFIFSYIQCGLKIVECNNAAERQGATPLSDSAFANTLVSDEFLEPMLSFLCSVSYTCCIIRSPPLTSSQMVARNIFLLDRYKQFECRQVDV